MMNPKIHKEKIDANPTVIVTDIESVLKLNTAMDNQDDIYIYIIMKR